MTRTTKNNAESTGTSTRTQCETSLTKLETTLDPPNKARRTENGKTNRPDDRNAPPRDSPAIRKGRKYVLDNRPSIDALVLAGTSLLDTTTGDIYNPGSDDGTDDKHEQQLPFFPETTPDPNASSPPPDSINEEDDDDMTDVEMPQQPPQPPPQQPPPPPPDRQQLDQQAQAGQVRKII